MSRKPRKEAMNAKSMNNLRNKAFYYNPAFSTTLNRFERRAAASIEKRRVKNMVTVVPKGLMK